MYRNVRYSAALSVQVFESNLFDHTYGRNAGVAQMEESGALVKRETGTTRRDHNSWFLVTHVPLRLLLRAAANRVKGNPGQRPFGGQPGGWSMGGCRGEEGRQPNTAVGQLSGHDRHRPISAHGGNHLRGRPRRFRTRSCE